MTPLYGLRTIPGILRHLDSAFLVGKVKGTRTADGLLVHVCAAEVVSDGAHAAIEGHPNLAVGQAIDYGEDGVLVCESITLEVLAGTSDEVRYTLCADFADPILFTMRREEVQLSRQRLHDTERLIPKMERVLDEDAS